LVFLLVLVVGFRSGLVYLFLLCTICSVLLLSVFRGIFERWFVVLISYLFFGGIICVLAYFSSFRFSSLRFSNFRILGILLLICRRRILVSKRFCYRSTIESGFSWAGIEFLSFFRCFILLMVMFSVLSVNKEGWGGVRVFSL
jgi:hypothetical protein